MRVIVQIGYVKAGKGRKGIGQLVKAYLNDDEISWNNSCYTGRYLTSRTDTLKGLQWYACELDMYKADTLRLDVKTYIKGVGVEIAKTFEALYSVDESAATKEIMFQGIGMKGYPLIKGRIIELGSVSEKDKHISDNNTFFGGEF